MATSTASSLPGYQSSADLERLARELPDDYLRTVLASDDNRFADFSLNACDLLLDYSRHLVDQNIIQSLTGLAEEAGLKQAIEAQLSGQIINTTEQRAVLHSALRAEDIYNSDAAPQPVLVQGEDIKPAIKAMHRQMQAICERIHSGAWVGHTGKPVRQVVNIGIGGSFLGLKVVTDALKPFHNQQITPHYVANIDPADISGVLNGLDAEETLFIIASKTFTTLETLANARVARQWLLDNGVAEDDLGKHLIAVSCNIQAATEFGVAEQNILPLWDWVGGRYSLWSAIGLVVALTIGYDNFRELLRGAGEMDDHFRTASFEQNMPVITALLGLWYHHWFDAQSHAVISYDHGLRGLVDHLQQVDMESNGKRTRKDGSTVDYQTGPIIWGGSGTNDQHAYMQLLHQGTRTIPVDLIMPATSHTPVGDQHAWLFTNGLAQANALACGRTLEQVREELAASDLPQDEVERLAAHKEIPGNRPCSLLLCKALTPKTLGAILAMYEQKVFVQGVIWKINSFDQWGVELGKLLGKQLYPRLSGGSLDDLDSSTRSVIEFFRQSQD